MKQNETLSSRIFDIINYIFLIILGLTFIYPIILTLSLSVSSSIELGHKNISILPIGFSLESYYLLLSDGRILRYYLNSVLYAMLSAVFMLVFTSMMAYPLTIPGFKGKKIVAILLIITMFFNGGLVPYYLIVQKLGMIDKIWVMVLPGAINAMYVIIFRTFFSDIPSALRESAQMDGAGNFSILFKIILPLSKPLMATFALFTIVASWNDFLTALLFLRNQDKYPIQMLLRRMLVLIDFRDLQNLTMVNSLGNISSRTVKSAAVIITIVPILCVYPFMQKYFTKGMLIGSIKA